MKNIEWYYDPYDGCWLWRSTGADGADFRFPYEFKVKIRTDPDADVHYYATFYNGRYLKRESRSYATLQECKDAAAINIHRLAKIILKEDVPNYD